MTEAKTLDYKGISGCSLFEGIEKSNIKAMLKCIGAYEKKYKKGEYISIEEDFVRSVGIVLSGVVDMIKEDVWGNSTVVVRMKDNEIMAVEHVEYPIFGLQFHPESVLTPKGKEILNNFLNI